MNFIVKLSLSKNIIINVKYNSILIVVNKLTKYTNFIPGREKKNAKDLAKVMLNKIIFNLRIPQSIISNIDILFIFKFWNT